MSKTKNFIYTVLLISSLISAEAYAKCVMVKSKDVKVGWTAFKTPAKAGVKGTLKNVTLSANSADSLNKLLSNLKFNIDGMSVNTKNPARDKKIAKFVFSSLKDSGKISGSLKGLKKNSLQVELMINGVKKVVPLKLKSKFSKDMKSLKASGHIDMLDFSMNKQLADINKACLALHEGKTWSDVEISVSAKISSCK